jgi:hypothetical protein
MKNIGLVLCVVALLAVSGCAGQQSSAPSTPSSAAASKATASGLYTAYNIWIMAPHNMKCINYKYGNNFLPAGTPVQKIHIGEDERPRQEYVGFETVGGKQKFKILYEPSWHPGKKIDHLKSVMFTSKTFQEMTDGLTQREIDAIRAGKIVDGMASNAVLIAYGYPPEHRTPTLDRTIWVYWSNKFTSFNVCFDEAQKTVICK